MCIRDRLQLLPNARFFVGVDTRGVEYRCAIMNMRGEILFRHHLSAQELHTAKQLRRAASADQPSVPVSYTHLDVYKRQDTLHHARAESMFFQLRLVFLLHAAAFEQLIVKLLNLQHRQLFQLHAAKLWNDMVINRVMVKLPC